MLHRVTKIHIVVRPSGVAAFLEEGLTSIP